MEFLGHMVVLFLVIVRKFHAAFYNGSTNLYSYQQCTRVLFSSHFYQHLLYMLFMMIGIQTGMK